MELINQQMRFKRSTQFQYSKIVHIYKLKFMIDFSYFSKLILFNYGKTIAYYCKYFLTRLIMDIYTFHLLPRDLQVMGLNGRTIFKFIYAENFLLEA